MKKGLVSVIMPCYNQGNYLPEALESIISQTYPKWECIIINDGSTDHSERVAKEYCRKDSRIRYIYQENAGVIAARNHAVSESLGEFILPLDADDTVSCHYLEKAVHVLTTDPSCKIVYGKGWLTGEKNEPFILPPFSIEGLLRDNCIFNSAIYRHQDFDNVGGYNPNMKEGYEDWNLWLSLLEGGGYAHKLDEVVYYYRIQSKSRTTEADQNEIKLRLQILENHKELYMRYYMNLYDQHTAFCPSNWLFKLTVAVNRLKNRLEKYKK